MSAGRWIGVSVVMALLIPIQVVGAAVNAVADVCEGGVTCDAFGNDDLDGIVGRILIPAAGFEGDPQVRSEAIQCVGCQWALTPSCFGNDEQIDNGCRRAVTLCPSPALRYDILRRRPGETAFVWVGATCIAPGAPRTVDELIPRVRARFLDLLPVQQPTFQPAAGGLVNVPVVFAAGQPGTIGRDTFDLAGMSVVVTAEAQWAWDFGDGPRELFDRPGGAFPNMDVTHTYVTAEPRDVRLTTTWDGDFSVDGLGPFPLSGPPVTQVSPVMPVTIRTAWSELVSQRGILP